MIEGQEGVTWDQWRALATTAEAARLRRRCSAPTTTCRWTAARPRLARRVGDARRRSPPSPRTLQARHARLTRHLPPPLRARREVVTADHVSGGRVELGLGAGWHEGEHRAFGFPFETRPRPLRPARRADGDRPPLVDRGRRSTSRAASTASRDANPLPKPVQQPHPRADRRRQRQPRAPRSPPAGPTSTTPSTRPVGASAASGASAWRAACAAEASRPIPFSLMTASPSTAIRLTTTRHGSSARRRSRRAAARARATPALAARDAPAPRARRPRHRRADRPRADSGRQLSCPTVARDWYDLFLSTAAPEPDAPDPGEREEKRRGFFRRLRENMRKTREALAAEVQATLFEGDLDEATWERLEEALIYADVGARTTAAGRRGARARGRGGHARRRRGAHRPARRAARRARPHRRRQDRPAARPDRDPRRRRQRHRQDDDDRQARLAPAQDARPQGRDRRRGHVPRRRRRAARALGRARRRRRRQGPGGLRPRRGRLRRDRPRPRARRRRDHHRHRRPPAHADAT